MRTRAPRRSRTFADTALRVSVVLLAFHGPAGAAAERDDTPPRRDAAEQVQEGSVRNWVEYYQREYAKTRMPRPGDAAAPAPAPDAAPPHQPPSPGR